MKIKFSEYKVFGVDNQNGNSAGVMFDKLSELSKEEMQIIAQKIGFSETVFIVEKEGSFFVRYFTPENEIDFCGHATLATIKHLMINGFNGKCIQNKFGNILFFNEKEMIFIQSNPLKIGQEIPLNEIFECFSDLEQNEIDLAFNPKILDTGLRDIFVKINSRDVLQRLTPNLLKISNLCNRYNCVSIHLFSELNSVSFQCRNFAPLFGIDEEPATGSSNSAIGIYFLQKNKTADFFDFYQGDNLLNYCKIRVLKKSEKKNGISYYLGGNIFYLSDKTFDI